MSELHEIDIPMSGEQSIKGNKLLSLCKEYLLDPLKDLFKAQTSEEAKPKEKQVYADVIVRNQKGEILLLERSYNDDFMPGKWALPGGKVELGESFSDGAKRELAEETFLTDLDLQYLMTVEKEDCRIHYFTTILNNYPFIVLDNDEHYRLEFVKPEEIKNYNTILDFDDIFYNKLYPMLSSIEPLAVEEGNDFLDRETILVQIQKAVSLELLSRACDSGEVDDDKYLSLLQKAINNESDSIPDKYKFKSLRKFTRSLETETLQKALDKDRILF